MEFVNIQMLSGMEQQAVGFGGHVGIAEPHQPPHLDAFAGQNACHTVFVAVYIFKCLT